MEFCSPLIDVTDARVTYQGLRALDDVTLSLHAGEHLALRGGNGAGKSTLLRLLRGEQWPDQDSRCRIVWHTAGGPETSPLAGRGMVSLIAPAQQERILLQGWDITGEDLVFGGISEAVYVLRHAEGEDKARIHELAAQLDAEPLLSRRVPELSQGELRRLLVARGLIRNPRALLLDEVTDGLDADSRLRLLAMLEKASVLSTLVISTHRPETLPDWMHREICMEHGRIVSDRALPGKPVAHLAVSSNCGMDLTPQLSGVKHGEGARIEIVNATVYLSGTPVLHDINWTIEPGQNWAVLGDNGAGKSTLMRLVAGDEFAAAGGSVRRWLPRQGGEQVKLECIRKGIRLVSDLQQATYTYDITGEELVFSGIDNSVGVYRAIASDELDEAHYCMRLLGVEHLARRSIRRCSTGEMRRLLLARALIGSPDLLLLDEPCSGLDPAARDHVLELVDALMDQGVQIVLVSHRREDLIPTITHLLRLDHGRVTWNGPCPEDLLS